MTIRNMILWKWSVSLENNGMCQGYVCTFHSHYTCIIPILVVPVLYDDYYLNVTNFLSYIMILIRNLNFFSKNPLYLLKFSNFIPISSTIYWKSIYRSRSPMSWNLFQIIATKKNDRYGLKQHSMQMLNLVQTGTILLEPNRGVVGIAARYQRSVRFQFS